MNQLYYIALVNINDRNDIIYKYTPIKHEIGANLFHNGQFYKVTGYMPVEF